MSFKNSKVVIVGCGNVGATTGYTIVNQGLCEQIVLIDVNKDKAYAEALGSPAFCLLYEPQHQSDVRRICGLQGRGYCNYYGVCADAEGQPQPAGDADSLHEYHEEHCGKYDGFRVQRNFPGYFQSC